ncbi:MAG: hypothetical protein RL329_1385 [Bacteroidota bacterium]
MTCLTPNLTFAQGWIGANGSQLYPSGTNVSIGIGTTAPAAQLHTTGTLLFQNMGNNNNLTRLMVTDANGAVRWRDISTVIPAPLPTWGLAGNAVSAGQFIGTTNNMPLIFKSNGVQVGNLSSGTNSMMGANAGISTTSGTYNSFFGSTAGNRNTSGTYNSFFGSNAGFNNTTGNYNNFLGSYAGYSNTTGYSNSFVGVSAGQNNTTGSNNSFLGVQTGFSNTTGAGNSFMGMQSGYYNTTGSNNSFLGLYAGINNTTGNNNSFMGMQTGFRNSTGSNNSFVGVNAGYNNSTGNNNNFWGFSSGFANSTGSNNNFLGFQAGMANTTGYQNNFLGMNAGSSNTTGSNSVYLGQQTGASNTTGNANTFVGSLTGTANTTQSENTYIGYNTGNVANANGNQNTFIGTNAGSTAAVSASSAIGYNATVARNNALILGNINDANLTVGIGIAIPWYGYKLHAAGNVLANNYYVPSDQRLKQNIQTIKDPMAIITGLNGKTYEMRTKAFEERHFDAGRMYGFLAQELQKVMPEAVKENAEGFLTVNYDFVIPVLTEGIKTQQKTIETLQAELEEIKKILKSNTVSKSTDAAVLNSKRVETVKLEQNRPNPTASIALIAYEMPQTMNQGNLIITDLTGKMIQNITLENNHADVTVDVSNMADGIYVYSLVVKGEVLASKKMMVQK